MCRPLPTSSTMPICLLYTSATVVFVLVELMTVGLTSIWFAAGSFVAFIIALLGGNVEMCIRDSDKRDNRERRPYRADIEAAEASACLLYTSLKMP